MSRCAARLASVYVEVLLTMHLSHVVLIGIGALNRQIDATGRVMRHVIQVEEDEQVEDKKVGAENHAAQTIGQNEAAEVEREFVVELQVGVAPLLLAETKLGEGIKAALVGRAVFVEDSRVVIVAVVLIIALLDFIRFARFEARGCRLQVADLLVEFDIVGSQLVEFVGEEHDLLLAGQRFGLELLALGFEALTLIGDNVE